MDGVHARRENAQLLARVLQREVDFGAFAAADPIALHDLLQQ